MRSKIDFKLASYMPAAAAEGMSKQMADQLANGVVLRIKGKRSLTSSGPFLLISDQEKGTVTLLDPKGKRYATGTLAEYADALKASMVAMPAASRAMLDDIKIDVKTSKTGKTEVIKGIKAEEMLISMNMEMPGPMAAMGMNMELHLWAAASEELQRVPALKELADYVAAQAAGSDPTSMVSKIFGQMPGLGEKLKAPMEEMMKASSRAILRTQVMMRMPGSATMMGAKDPNEPFTNITTDMTEFSTEGIPESVFQVPAGYEAAKLEDLVALSNPLRQQPQQEPPAPPAAAAALRPGGLTPPVLLRKVEPSYTEEARAARIQGTVTLYVQVNPQGKAINMKVLRSLDPGLDVEAMNAVKEWEFRPGSKDGRPVTVESRIEVNFRLLDKQPGQWPHVVP